MKDLKERNLVLNLVNLKYLMFIYIDILIFITILP